MPTPHVFRTLAVERYAARRESVTLPKLRPPRQRRAAAVLLLATLSAMIGLARVTIPVFTTVPMLGTGASIIEIAPVPSTPLKIGQRVFVRRQRDGVVVAHGTIFRLLSSAGAKARVEGTLTAFNARVATVVIQTGEETLLHAVMRRARNSPFQQPTDRTRTRGEA